MSARPIATTRSAAGIPTGRLAVWWVIASEIVIFGGLLASYIMHRLAHDAWSIQAAATNTWIGAFNTLVLLTQLFLTGRILKGLGVGLTLAILPLLSMAGFLALGAMPVFAVFVVFHVLRRAGNFAVAVPAREVLYTVLSRRDKYKAKNFNDTFVYRAGDQIGAWSFAGLGAAGLGTAAMAWTMVPVAGTWLLVALWLGRRQRDMAA